MPPGRTLPSRSISEADVREQEPDLDRAAPEPREIESGLDPGAGPQASLEPGAIAGAPDLGRIERLVGVAQIGEGEFREARRGWTEASLRFRGIEIVVLVVRVVDRVKRAQGVIEGILRVVEAPERVDLLPDGRSLDEGLDYRALQGGVVLETQGGPVVHQRDLLLEEKDRARGDTWPPAHGRAIRVGGTAPRVRGRIVAADARGEMNAPRAHGVELAQSFCVE